MQVTTAGGSTYFVGPSRRRNYVKVARVSDHAVSVKGVPGRRTFAEDFAQVEVVSDGAHLRLLCTRESGRHLRTSPIVDVMDQGSLRFDRSLTDLTPSPVI